MNKKNITEELKKHNRLVEYTFYVGEDDEITGNSDDKDLILGEEPEDDVDDETENDSDNQNELDIDSSDSDGSELDFDSTDNADDVDSDFSLDDSEELEGSEGSEDVDDDFSLDSEGDEEIELDVTDLVQNTKKTKEEAELASSKMEELLQQFNMLNTKLKDLEDLDTKLAELEQEVIKRNPTKVEKLEMRSLDSFPYNLKLTDYWEDKESEGDIEAVSDDKSEEDEYELTDSDIEQDYSEQEVVNSFDPDTYEEDDFNFLGTR